jgi:hypothetical protein
MSITLMILSLVAGSLAQEINTDYDRNADFSHYKTLCSIRFMNGAVL